MIDTDVLKSMILYYITNRGLVTDRQLGEALNLFTNIGALDLQGILRELAEVEKLHISTFKVPLKQGQFGTFMVVGVPKTELD